MITDTTLTLIAKVVKGKVEAMRFFVLILEIIETWDGLVDKDEPVSDEQINFAFTTSLVGLQNNGFYREHIDKLQPLLVNAIINWRIANVIERDVASVDELRWSFVIRSSYIDLLLMAAACIDGIEWAVAMGPEVRRYVHQEGFDNYLAALKIERVARGEVHGMLRQ